MFHLLHTLMSEVLIFRGLGTARESPLKLPFVQLAPILPWKKCGRGVSRKQEIQSMKPFKPQEKIKSALSLPSHKRYSPGVR